MTPAYFQVMGIPLMKGRGITERDVEGALPVVVVNDEVHGQVATGALPEILAHHRGE